MRESGTTGSGIPSCRSWLSASYYLVQYKPRRNQHRDKKNYPADILRGTALCEFFLLPYVFFGFIFHCHALLSPPTLPTQSPAPGRYRRHPGNRRCCTGPGRSHLISRPRARTPWDTPPRSGRSLYTGLHLPRVVWAWVISSRGLLFSAPVANRGKSSASDCKVQNVCTKSD
jgi:hypothetical protein